MKTDMKILRNRTIYRFVRFVEPVVIDDLTPCVALIRIKSNSSFLLSMGFFFNVASLAVSLLK